MVSGVGFVPVEAVADDGFDDPAVGGGGGADADAEVDFPGGGEVEVDGGEDLLLLVVEGGGAG